VVALVLTVAVVVSLALVITIRRPLPDYAGEVEVPGLGAEVRVVRDERGVAQVYAADAADLFYGQGYVHAQDRFFEMDFRRHVTAGRLSELVGASDTALAADTVVRTLGWRRVAEAELPLLEPDTRAYLQSYADGVNAYLAQRSPGELSVAYTVLDVQVELGRIEAWTPLDSLAWLKAMAWDLRSNYEDELGRALTLLAVRDVALVEQLYPPYPEDRNAPVLGSRAPVAASAASATPVPAPTPPAPTAPAPTPTAPMTTPPMTTPEAPDWPVALMAADDGLESAARALDAVPRLLGDGDGVGSNSWVVSGDHTESGSPLLANDPHLAPSMPGIWYQVGLHCTEVTPQCPFDVSGFSFAGFPGVVVGHNAQIAWGITNLGPDVTDFFLEAVADDTYLRDGVQVPLEQRTEVIAVAGAEPVEITVRSTVHGPIVSGVLPAESRLGALPVPEGSPRQGDGYEVSLAWTALTPGRTADAVFAFDRAQSWEEFRAAASLFEVPAQNLVYADVSGRVGYQAPGRIPIRPAGPGLGRQDGTYPRLGWDSTWDWVGYIPFAELPSVLDPPEGLLVTANQAVVGAGYPYRITSDWDYGYRAQRIREQLTEMTADGGSVTVADMAVLQTDTRNGFAEVLVPFLLDTPLSDESVVDPGDRAFTQEALGLLGGPGGVTWDYEQEAGSAAAAYYNAVWSNLLRLAFADQLPEVIRPSGGDRWFEAVGLLLSQERSPWWDSATTPTIVETRDQILGQALVDARLELTASLGKDPQSWEWGKLHRLTLEHQPLGAPEVPAAVRALFNAGGVGVGGGSSIVNATSWDAAVDQDYSVTAAPSMRMVVDLADLDASTWVDLTGVSGHPWSSHYGDQTQAWLDGEQYPWPFTPEAVERSTQDELVLRPRPGGG
jgi:penicillin amidase